MPDNLALLVVDGYNVIHGTPRYRALIDDATPDNNAVSTAAAAYTSDPFDRARELLVADVATYAQGRFEPVIVFDAAGNVSPERPDPLRGGVRLMFSRTGESADTLIERLVTKARLANRDVTLVTSDNTIRFTVGGVPVTVISAALLVADIEIVTHDVAEAAGDRAHGSMTLEARLPADQRARLWELLGGHSS